jgi:hypothetical protein
MARIRSYRKIDIMRIIFTDDIDDGLCIKTPQTQTRVALRSLGFVFGK